MKLSIFLKHTLPVLTIQYIIKCDIKDKQMKCNTISFPLLFKRYRNKLWRKTVSNVNTVLNAWKKKLICGKENIMNWNNNTLVI